MIRDDDERRPLRETAALQRKQQFEAEQLLLIELCDEVTDLDPSQCG